MSRPTMRTWRKPKTKISVEYSGSPIEIGFNVAYLIEVLNVLKNDSVRISLGEQKKSGFNQNAG